MLQKPRIAIEYFGGPLDGIREEQRVVKATMPQLVGMSDSMPPEGWYAAVDDEGRRRWHQGAPRWWKRGKGE